MIKLSPIELDDQGVSRSRMSGTLLSEEVRVAKQQLVKCIEGCRTESCIVDVSELETVSSAAVALLLSGLRAAERCSCRLSYQNLSEYLSNMARVGGVDSILIGE